MKWWSSFCSSIHSSRRRRSILTMIACIVFWRIIRASRRFCIVSIYKMKSTNKENSIKHKFLKYSTINELPSIARDLVWLLLGEQDMDDRIFCSLGCGLPIPFFSYSNWKPFHKRQSGSKRYFLFTGWHIAINHLKIPKDYIWYILKMTDLLFILSFSFFLQRYLIR